MVIPMYPRFGSIEPKIDARESDYRPLDSSLLAGSF